jgi:hypothetical protein
MIINPYRFKQSTPPFSNVNSFSFDGIDDYFIVPDTSGLSFGNGTTDSPFSISAWIKPLDNVRFRIAFKFGTSLREYYFQTTGSGALQVQLNSSQFVYIGRNGQTTISENVWSHVLFTYDGSGNKNNINIYLNGVLDNGSAISSGTYTAMSNTTQPLEIGRYNGGGYANGLIDETAIFTTELSQSDISAIYNNGEPQSLDAYSPFVWFRMGDNATWNGFAWTMTSVGTDTRTARSANMVEANRTTDVPTIPFSTKSIALDGVDDFVNVTDADNLSFGDGSSDSPFSISAWIKMNDATRFFVLSKGLVFSSNYEYLLNTNASDKLALSLYDSSNNSRIGRLYNTPLTSYENQWVHICSTYSGNGLSSGIKVYINGVRVDDTDSNSGTYVAMENGNRNLNIGRTETGLYSNGKIDEVSVFNTELSQSDITSIYGGGVPSSLSSYSSLVSWWRFEGSGTTAIDSGSGGNNGTLTNGVTRSTDVPTFSKKSIALDGVDDFINVPNSASLQITSALSISFWIYGRNNAKHTGIITKTPNTSNLVSTTQYHIQFQDSNKLRFAITGLDLYAGQETTGTVPTVVAGVWQHITMTWNGSDTMTIYKDGAQVCTKVQSTTISSNTDAVYLGRRNGWGHLLGKLDEVSIFNTELSSSNVTSIYNGGEPNDISSLSPISWWRCGDGDTSPTLTDNGSGGNDGTMTNFTTFSTDVPT